MKKYLKATAISWFLAAICLATLAQMVAPPAVFAAQPVYPRPQRGVIAFNSDFDRIPAIPAVTNYTGASDITATTALLTGKVISRGCPPHNVPFTPTMVHIFWGTVNGGNIATKWQHDANLGIQPGNVFAAYVAGLTPGTTYYYRSFLRNSAGAVWAATSDSLTTRDIVD